MKPEDVTIVLPALNEEQAIKVVLDELLSAGYSNILVVDGFSTDRTVEIAKAMNVAVIQQHWHGKTGALKAAIDRVKTPYLLVMDCDGTYDPNDIPKFLAYAESYEYILGARLIRKPIPPINRIGNKIINLVFTVMTGTRVNDVGSGMYMLNTEAARTLELHTSGVDSEVEIAIQMTNDYNYTEVPINYRDRLGKAKLSPVKDGISDILTILKLSRVYNPVQLFLTIGSLLMVPAGIILLWSGYETFVRGVWHAGWILIGILLLVFGLQAFSISTVSVIVYRMERRLEKRLRGNARVV